MLIDLPPWDYQYHVSLHPFPVIRLGGLFEIMKFSLGCILGGLSEDVLYQFLIVVICCTVVLEYIHLFQDSQFIYVKDKVLILTVSERHMLISS